MIKIIDKKSSILLKQLVTDTSNRDIAWIDTIQQVLEGIYYNHTLADSFANHAALLPFQEICYRAQQKYNQYIHKDIYAPIDLPSSHDYSPDFLIILDHLCYYLFRSNESIFLRTDCQSLAERYWAIFAMRQIGLSKSETKTYEQSTYTCNWYSELIHSACEAYRLPLYQNSTYAVSPLLLETLLYCNVLSPFKYPFFILNYKDRHIQIALTRLVALSTLPCGLKTLAKKILSGKPTHTKEVAYMQGYAKFRESYLTLP